MKDRLSHVFDFLLETPHCTSSNSLLRTNPADEETYLNSGLGWISLFLGGRGCCRIALDDVEPIVLVFGFVAFVV